MQNRLEANDGSGLCGDDGGPSNLVIISPSVALEVDRKLTTVTSPDDAWWSI